MKTKYIIPFFSFILIALSCSSSDDADDTANELEGLTKITQLTNDTHTIELYNTSGTFYTGYNHLNLRLKDNSTNQFVENAILSWMPIMDMLDMKHSCPKSDISKVNGKATVYEGYIVYQMANIDGSGWSLKIDYSLDGVNYSASSDIIVLQNDLQNVTSFMGSDDERYVMALVEPQDPKIAVNRMKVALFKMETMMLFPSVADYKITLDPRMPGMGNHSSPNNTDLQYDSASAMYHGDLSLTMTGYWVLNLKLLNVDNEALKGEDITEERIKSSLYFELEF